MPSLNTGNAILSNPIKVETTAYNVGIGGAASSSFKLQVTGTTNLTGALTGTSATFSGNVAIGTTSSAWSGFTALDISNVGSLAVFPSFGVSLFRNAYYDGSVYRYKITSAASYYDQDSNASHIWYNAPSGTAGNAISFTQAMTLTAAGNLGIGTSSPTSISGFSVLAINNTTGSLLELKSNGTSIGQIYVDSNALNIEGIFAKPTIFINNGSERMRITSGGNVLIGTTTDNGNKFQVSTTGNNVASFTGTQYANLRVVSTSSTYDAQIEFVTPSASAMTWSLGKRDDGLGGVTVGSLWLYNSATSSAALWIHPSTNAATFSSSVTADSFVSQNGFSATYNLGTIAQNATITQSIPKNGLWIITNGGNLSGLILITRAGGSQGVQLIFTTGGNNVAAGTTSNPSSANYLNVWVGTSGVLSIENVNAYTGPYYMTSIATY
jgi:hypothetical protein